MGIGDIRYTVLEVVNEVFRELGLSQVTSLTSNKLSVETVDFINDICDELSDFGNWQEVLTSGNIAAVSGQIDYSIVTSGNVKNIADIFFSSRRGPMREISVQEMRILTRSTSVGVPTQFAVFGTDANGNPNIRVRPVPAENEVGEVFSVLYYARAPRYTTADADAVIPFPGKVVKLGVLAKSLLSESNGSPTDKYKNIYTDYLTRRKEALNRYNADTGWGVQFAPSNARRGRR